MKLPEKETELMHILWEKEKAFMKEILDAYTDPKPAATTTATLLKRLIDKKYVGYQEFGNSRQYFPLIQKNDFFSSQVNGLIKNFFNDSAAQFATFFTKTTKMSATELEELKKIIDNQIQKQK